ncbi:MULTISPECIES: Rpn family recombination-promoting nuclease/putative transposase [Clostridium]|uniref:Rpn family recombination-promoting nuclease/putative transposase n=1 Tax=Clostridium TaxID=1485 RepID=UPI0029088321|nr:Rpn family recombination-promoting nuclease/putative transposase [Clostridium sp.]MDU4737569.1 Rpn family recombination-promoting nuclease/putative transposase [Clostridium sp.]
MSQYSSFIYKDLFSNKETFLNLILSFISNTWVPIVLYNGKKKWTAAKELKHVISNSDVFGDTILNFKYEFIYIYSYDKEELYNKQNISSAIFLLDQNINRIEFYNRLKDIIIVFNNLSREEKMHLKHWLVNINTEENNFKDNIEKYLMLINKRF